MHKPFDFHKVVFFGLKVARHLETLAVGFVEHGFLSHSGHKAEFAAFERIGEDACQEGLFVGNDAQKQARKAFLFLQGGAAFQQIGVDFDLVGNLLDELEQFGFGLFGKHTQSNQRFDNFPLEISEFEHGEVGLAVAADDGRTCFFAVEFVFFGHIGLDHEAVFRFLDGDEGLFFDDFHGLPAFCAVDEHAVGADELRNGVASVDGIITVGARGGGNFLVGFVHTIQFLTHKLVCR